MKDETAGRKRRAEQQAKKKGGMANDIDSRRKGN